MKIIKAPQSDYSLASVDNIRIFLAGGITQCIDWQQKIIDKFEFNDRNFPISIFNPRRDDFDSSNKQMEEEQICWEFYHLKNADVLLFWFSGETVNPITLYELGMWCNSRSVPAVVGIDPNYCRKTDVTIQTKLARKDVYIVFDLDALYTEARRLVKNAYYKNNTQNA